MQKSESDEAVREMMFFQSIPSHKHLLKMLDTVVQQANLCLVFEYLYNCLSDVFHRAEGLLHVDVAQDYSCQVLQGLIHVHSHQVAHRDLSMGNILLDIPSNTLKIADLGLAACASHFVLDRNITAIWYRAPEVLLHIKQLDFPQSAFDMWSYGVVMCALLCGTHLFCSSSNAKKDIEIKVLQKQIDLLGPPDWPGIKELPTWSEYPQLLQIEESGVSTDLRAKLASTKFVRRPLGSLEIELLGGLLRWCPSSRMTAVEAGSHIYWSAASQPTSEKTVGGCSLSSQASGTEAGVPPLFSQARIETLSLGESGVCVAPPQGLLQDGRVARLGKNRVCSNAALPGASHCRACKCEKHDCDKRKSPREIYCAAHVQEQRKVKKGQYMNKWSVWELDAGWPWKLQMVALHGWMLARMSPCDLDAFLEGATATVGTCNRLTGSMLLHLWAMAFFKWPECVTQWASVVSDAAGRPGVSAGSLDVRPEFFASKSVELACHCDVEDSF